LDADLSSDRVQVARLDGQPLLDTPLHAALTVKDLIANLEQPSRSDASGHLAIEAGPHLLAFEVAKHGDTLSYELTARAPQLALAVPFLSPELAQQAPWDKTALELHSRGTLEHLNASEPELHQHSQLQLTGAGYKATAVRSLALELQSDGTTNRQKARAVLHVEGLTANGNALGDDQLALSLSFDRGRQSIELTLDNDRIVKAQLTASMIFDRAQRALTYHLTSDVSHFSAQLPQFQALTGVDLSTLELRLGADGTVAGLVMPRSNGELALAPDALSNARGSCTLTLAAAGVSWANGDRAFRAPTATLHAAINVQPGHRTVESDLTSDAFEIALGRRHLDISGFHDRTSLAVDGPSSDVSLELAQEASVATLKQNFASLYPVGNASLTVHARRAPDGVIEISDLRLENRAGGTTLTASGGVDLSDDQRRLTLRANLQQDLRLVSSRRDVFFGSGQASLDLAVQSPDFRVFHNQATLRLNGAHAHFSRSQTALDAVDGEVPILLDLTVSQRGVELLRGVQVNPYATLRFADQHPLLSTRSFLSIGQLTTPMLSIAPFAANLKIEQNIVSLSQLELGVRGGSITGDGVFDWNGAQSTLQADVHASGVQSSHGEPFDGNAALLVDLGDRSIEGRADILRIGRRHLLDLLDLEDPHRANSAMNRIRSALGYGYPERVRITFKHGFASAGVSFGGLASLVSVDDVRGIPIGPLMERAVSSFGPEQEP
jgi:translocation and assembly module TamB